MTQRSSLLRPSKLRNQPTCALPPTHNLKMQQLLLMSPLDEQGLLDLCCNTWQIISERKVFCCSDLVNLFPIAITLASCLLGTAAPPRKRQCLHQPEGAAELVRLQIPRPSLSFKSQNKSIYGYIYQQSLKTQRRNVRSFSFLNSSWMNKPLSFKEEATQRKK